MLAPLLVWVIILLFVSPFYLISLVILGSWRLIVNFIVWKWKSNIVAHFTSRDLAFTCDAFHGKVRKSIITVTILKGRLDLDTLREGIRSRLLANPFAFKLHCRPISYLGYWFWEKTDLQVNSHIYKHNRVQTEDELKSFLPAWGQQPYAPGCPMWGIVLIELDKDRSAVAIKYHHMLGDGVSCMRLLEHVCDSGWIHLQTPPVKSMSIIHWAYAWFTFPWNALKSYRLAKIRKGFRPKLYCGEGLTSWTELPLEKIRVIRRSSKCLFQSVMSGILSNAFYLYIEATAKLEAPPLIRMVVPIPYPYRSDASLINHIAWLHSEMPIGEGMETLSQVDDNIKRSYALGMHGVMWEFFRGMYLIPNPLLKSYTTWGEVNIPPVLVSSVPGTLGQVSILGHEVIRSNPVLSLGCSMGVNATVTTYKDKAQFTIRVSKEIIPTQDLLDQLLNKYMHEAIDHLYKQAIASDFYDPNSNNPQLQIQVHDGKLSS